jgi:hypothetical protein
MPHQADKRPAVNAVEQRSATIILGVGDDAADLDLFERGVSKREARLDQATVPEPNIAKTSELALPERRPRYPGIPFQVLTGTAMESLLSRCRSQRSPAGSDVSRRRAEILS